MAAATDGAGIHLSSRRQCTAGTYLYVASEVRRISKISLGLHLITPAHLMGINGDDAVELFENGTVIDTFGDPECRW